VWAVAELDAEGDAPIHAWRPVSRRAIFAHLRKTSGASSCSTLNIDRNPKGSFTLAQNLFNGGVATQIDVGRAAPTRWWPRQQLARFAAQTTVSASELLLKPSARSRSAPTASISRIFVVRRGWRPAEYVVRPRAHDFELPRRLPEAQKSRRTGPSSICGRPRFERLARVSLSRRIRLCPRWNFKRRRQKTAWAAGRPP